MTDEFLYDVFLSHNSKDKPRVRKLAERLKNAGLRVWFDEWNTLSGNDITERVYDGLNHSRVLVLCVSRNALASDWVTLERTTALHRDPADEWRRFVPLLLESCELPDTLKLYKFVDFRAEDDSAFAELVASCSIESDQTRHIQLQQPPSKSDFNFTLKDKLKAEHYIYRIAWHPSGHQIAAACEDGVRLWDPTTCELQFTLTTLSWRSKVFAVAYAPNGEMLASAGEGGEIFLWPTATGKKFDRLAGLDTQALEQILIGHMMAITGEANQIFRELNQFDYGIDGEVEFKDNDGRASGKRIYIQLKSGNSYLRTRKRDGSEVFDVSNERHLEYWTRQPEDVYLVIRQTNEMTGAPTIRWMNVTRYLNNRKDKKSRQIIFQGEKLDMEAVWKVRDQFFPPETQRR
jgi:WD40 repeat protein